MTLVPLTQVTQQKFGQAGLEAIKKYPYLLGAKIDPRFYLKEAGVATSSSGNFNQWQEFDFYEVGTDRKVIHSRDVRQPVYFDGQYTSNTASNPQMKLIFQPAGVNAVLASVLPIKIGDGPTKYVVGGLAVLVLALVGMKLGGLI